MNSKIKNILYYLPKDMVTKIRYRYVTNRKLDLGNPDDFNSKVCYLMLKCFTEKETNCADKYLVRKYVEEKGLQGIIPKMYGVYNNADQIDFSSLPDKYVLKTNHGCGCTIIKHENEQLENIK